jgi:hypothetical protein
LFEHPSLTREQDLETMSREMDLWVRDAQVQQQRYDDERRKTEMELEPLLIKLQVMCFVKGDLLSTRARRSRERSRPSIGFKLHQRALHALATKRSCSSIFAKFQTSIKNYQASQSFAVRELVVWAPGFSHRAPELCGSASSRIRNAAMLSPG